MYTTACARLVSRAAPHQTGMWHHWHASSSATRYPRTVYYIRGAARETMAKRSGPSQYQTRSTPIRLAGSAVPVSLHGYFNAAALKKGVLWKPRNPLWIRYWQISGCHAHEGSVQKVRKCMLMVPFSAFSSSSLKIFGSRDLLVAIVERIMS